MSAQQASATVQAPQSYQGHCWVCGEDGLFAGDGGPIRETYTCGACGGSLRYQAQAQALVGALSLHHARSFAEVVCENHFRSLAIYEPGTLGPLRRYLQPLPGYTTSSFWPDVAPGEIRDGRRCEDLMHLTFDDRSFDLVITSDIFEHVRKPLDGFAEVGRVLRTGGMHVFSIPVLHPMARRSVPRVDTTTDTDVFLTPPNYHNGHLVYTDFGADLIDQLDDLGTPTEAVRFDGPAAGLDRVVTFRSLRAA